MQVCPNAFAEEEKLEYTLIQNGQVAVPEANTYVPPYVKPPPKTEQAGKWELFKHPSAMKIKVSLILVVIISALVLGLACVAVFQFMYTK